MKTTFPHLIYNYLIMSVNNMFVINFVNSL
ncbi:MAG: hypothetical protein FD143_3176 [Ignavibacteria bacterium]|nr:MAG: hypothetical protein FD143_3176 [Ignavibacteria bacterium]